MRKSQAARLSLTLTGVFLIPHLACTPSTAPSVDDIADPATPSADDEGAVSPPSGDASQPPSNETGGSTLDADSPIDPADTDTNPNDSLTDESGSDGSPNNDPTADASDTTTPPDDTTPPTLASLQVFPPDNPWNQDISTLPVHPNSDAYLRSIGLDTGLHPDFGTVWEGAPIGIPFTTVRGDQPMVPVSFYYADESDPGPYPIPPDAPVEGGVDSDGDRHVLVVDLDNRMLYEMFDARRRSDGGWDAGSGAVFDLTSNALRPDGWTSADAAGLPIFAGLVRYDEVVERGEVTHAVRFTVSRTQRAYIPPATHFASSSDDPDLPPMGLRVRLRADYDLSDFSPNVQTILRGLQRYGMYVADNGSNWYITGAHDPRWNDDELHELSRVKGRDFEVVYTGETKP